MLNYDSTVSTEVDGLSLHFLSSDDVHRLSVSEIKNIGYVGHESANKSCIYDPLLGSSDIYKICTSCNELSNCNGHLGHIDFAIPVYHPLMLPSLCRLLKTTCFYCKRIRLKRHVIIKYIKLFDLSRAGMLSDMLQFDQLFNFDDSIDSNSNNNPIKHKKRMIARILKRLNRISNYNNKSVATNADANTPKLSVNGKEHGIFRDNFDVTMWHEIRNRFFGDAMQTIQCPHCGSKSKLTIKPSSDNSCIEVSWPQSSKEPVFFKNIDKNILQFTGNIVEESKIDIVNMLNSELESPTADILNVTGKSVRMTQLQAFHLIPYLNEIFHKHSVLLSYILPQSKTHGWKIFIMDCMSISANRFRPPLVTAEKQIVLHARSSAILDIVVVNEFLKLMLKIKNHSNIKEIFKNETYISNLLGYSVDAKQLKQFQEFIYGDGSNFNVALLNNALNLQKRVSSYMDNHKPTGNTSLPPKPGIKQSMEHKTGTVRQNMLGKRVNYSARTVIAPDCFMDTNQMGIPLKFAMELTIPKYVTKYNVNLLRKLVLNGSKIYPGANFLRDSNGKLYNLSALSSNERAAKAKLLLTGITEGNSPRIVYRHVLDGDVVLMNRQPTLHKPGIMGHFVKVLTNQKIFRLNYVNCNTYNADFDGDEMNLHLPQDYLSQAEAQIIANADCQFVVPKNGQPIRGLIQDHCQGGALLTSKNTFLRKNEYYNLVYIALNVLSNYSDTIYLKDGDDLQSVYDDIKLDNTLYQSIKRMSISSDHFARKFSNLKHEIYIDTPAIIYPEKLWTGKQVITSVLKTLVDGISCGSHPDPSFIKRYNGINLVSKSQTPGDAWGGSNDGNTEESTIIIRNSELLQGVLDKSQFGATSYGLTHLVHELLGPRVCGMLLNSFSYLFTSFLQMHGATCSPKDFLLTFEGERYRNCIIRRIKYGGLHIQELFISAISDKHAKNINNFALSQSKTGNTSKLGVKDGDSIKKILLILGKLINDVNKILSTHIPRPESTYDSATDIHELISSTFSYIKPHCHNRDVCNTLFKALDKLSMVPELQTFVYPYVTSLKNDTPHKKNILQYFPSWICDSKKQSSIKTQKYSYKLGDSQDTCKSFYNLIRGKFRGNEQQFYHMFDRFFQNNIVGASNDINSTADHTLLKFPDNGFYSMVTTGAKGSKVNFSMICSAVSQQTLEGNRVPVMPSIRTLPSFAHGDFGSRAGGFITDRFLTGLRPQEYFFHCMSGREGLVDTCVKTAKSGYLQRCVLKAMEDVIVCYDSTVRTSDGSIIQFSYGEDGIDVSKCAYLDRPNDLLINSDLITHHPYEKLNIQTSESFLDMINKYQDDESKKVLLLHYKRSQCEPGDAVGCIAGQSIGEPATQMTLNTFHLAGHGATNVTLGIPRLIEILQTTGHSSTPYFSAPLLGETEAEIAESAQFSINALRKVPLSDVVHAVGVEGNVYTNSSGDKFWEYTATVQYENLYSFKKVVGAFKLQDVINLTSNCLLNRFLKKVIGLMIVTMDTHIPYELSDLSDHLQECWRMLVLQDQLIKKDKLSNRIRKMVLSSGSNTVNTVEGRVSTEVDKEEEPKDVDDTSIKDSDSGEESESDSSYTTTESSDEIDTITSDEELSDEEENEEIGVYQGFESDIKVGKQSINSINRKVFQFAHSLKYCKETSKLVLKFGWPFSKCPYYLDLIPLLRQEISQQILRDSPGIYKSRIVCSSQSGTDVYTLHCDGTNLKRLYMLKEGLVDFNKIKMNDFLTVLQYYGVEAARSCIVSELNKVFSSYGIKVNYRHLTLIADFMTQKGDIRTFTRYGMVKHTSPLLQMSFESTMKFLMEASERGAYDNLKSPTGAIMAGKPVCVGSGLCKVMQSVSIKENEQLPFCT